MKNFLPIFLTSLSLLFTKVYAQGDHIFSQDSIHEIRLNFSSPDFWSSLTQNYDDNYPDIPYIMAHAVIDGESIDSIGVRLKGFSSYFIQTQKKSIKLDFNEFVSGKKYDGLKKLNLNNGEGDPAILRDKLSYDILKSSGIAAPRTSYARLYLNDSYWGLYLLVEQIDKTFLTENFGSGEGNLFKNMENSALEWKGSDTSQYQQTFDLKTKDRQGAWTRFVNFLDVLNNSSDANFKSAIAQVFDVERYLKVLAVDVATGNWDSYIEHGRNFYLYENPYSKKFQWIPWDYNLAMGGMFSGGPDSTGSPGGPLDSLAVSQCATVLNGSCPYPASDSVLQKVMEFDSFCCENEWDATCQESYNRFANGDTIGGPGGPGLPPTSFPIDMRSSEKVLIKRLLAVAEYREIYYQSWCRLLGDNFTRARLFPKIDAAGNLIRPYIQADPNYPWSLQAFEEDLDQGNDLIPGLKKFIQDRIDSLSLELSGLYDCNALNVNLSFGDIVINEFCASCDSLAGIADPHGEYDDWIELYNNTSLNIDLSAAYLSDNISNPKKWSFPAGTQIAAGGYLIIWADKEEGQRGLHANFKLSKEGEALILSHNNTILDSLSFEAQDKNMTAARKPNGSGNFVIGSHSFNTNNDWATNIPNPWESDYRFTIFPNPAREYINLRFERIPPSGTEVKLLNMLGQILHQEAVRAIETQIISNSFSSGIYFIRLENDQIGAAITRKIQID